MPLVRTGPWAETFKTRVGKTGKKAKHCCLIKKFKDKLRQQALVLVMADP
ncbi:uncharacterized protein METZ01_LOCUS161858 [marine metagenome]|uniref:Uncharacterized protein n=1 Tax=marine metagenome TaxID=408172 RepID=A0A382B5W9_9ZZZZ